MESASVFRYKDYAHGGKHRVMTLTAVEFLHDFAASCSIRVFGRLNILFGGSCKADEKPGLP